MNLFIILATFFVMFAAICIAAIYDRVKNIQILLKENQKKNREASASLESQLHQINGSLIEIAALLKGQRPTS